MRRLLVALFAIAAVLAFSATLRYLDHAVIGRKMPTTDPLCLWEYRHLRCIPSVSTDDPLGIIDERR